MSNDLIDKIKAKALEEIQSDKRFYTRVLVISLLMIMGYFIFSPYQNCLREGSYKSTCVRFTSW